MFMAVKALLGDGEDDFSVAHDGGRGVGMKHVEAEDQHARRAGTKLDSSGGAGVNESSVRAGRVKSVIDEGGGIHGQAFSGGNRFVDTESRESRAHDFLERNCAFAAVANGLGKSGPLGAMSFVLTPARMDVLPAAVARQFETAKIFEHRDCAATENFQTFLGKRSVAIRPVSDGAFRTVGEAERYQHVVAAVASGIGERAGIDFDDWRASQKHERVHKVANLAANASAALLRIVHPMV